MGLNQNCLRLQVTQFSSRSCAVALASKMADTLIHSSPRHCARDAASSPFALVLAEDDTLQSSLVIADTLVFSNREAVMPHCLFRVRSALHRKVRTLYTDAIAIAKSSARSSMSVPIEIPMPTLSMGPQELKRSAATSPDSLSETGNSCRLATHNPKIIFTPMMPCATLRGTQPPTCELRQKNRAHTVRSEYNRR